MKRLAILLLLVSLTSGSVIADGIVVDKVYHPLVLANEQEFEWRFLSSQTEQQNRLAQRFGYGRALSDTVAAELYLIAERDDVGNFQFQSYELEVRWMLTEQGQYWADWGAVFEIERNTLVGSSELATGLLFEKEIGRNSLTLNAILIYEWGDGIEDEFETEFRAQYRYRYMAEVQPSIEVYVGENYFGIGPALMGVRRFNGQKQLKWEVGFISELSNNIKDHSLRFSLEYEF
ncbi:hypothetical protein [Psychrosphaera aestuarii]|uniref:hypothetical protein n=1 Tax=Psychrosphaera aestuarii TaxID=1266052 RepID=UPI001B336D86|nr:hypothetical protein [Psychrosphaera aestuarii]